MKETIRRLVQGVLLGFLLVVRTAFGGSDEKEETSGGCQILDQAPEPGFQVGVGYVPQSRFKGYGKSAFMEIGSDWGFAYFWDVAHGDVDLNLRMRSALMIGTAGLQLPDQVVKLFLDAGWTQRRNNGMAVQFRLYPGLYSDFEAIDADAVYMPFSLALIRSFSPDLSGIVGMEIRPGFDRLIMPIVGVELEINDRARLEARLPESRLVCAINEDYSAHAGFSWQNTSYALREKGDFDREQVTYEDFRLFVGVTRRLSDQLQFTGEIGRVFNRSVEFEEPAFGLASDLDVEPATFVRVALAGTF